MVCPHPSLSFGRTFSSTAATTSKNARSNLKHQVVPKQFLDLVPEHLHKSVPAYPYGPSRWYKQSNYGLFGGTHIQFGNSVSEAHEVKNRRNWKPNIHSKSLWSEALRRRVRIKLSTRVLRTIDKVGGLDAYVLGGKASRIKELGTRGWLLRWLILQTPVMKEKFAEERRKLGLPDVASAKAVSDEDVDQIIGKEDEESERMGEDEGLQETMIRGEGPGLERQPAV
ncbi:MAG: 39S ribosomal protein L24, mitochondrial [Sclerophora amabilis]|nr:MAG: 39S ribosomal protein L24, mitochondrial [Sclerophora amabilis]